MKNPFSNWKQNLKERRFAIVLILLLSLFAFFCLWPRMIYTIGPGEVGVKYMRFMHGTVTDKVYPESVKIIAPWDLMYIYDVRVHEKELDVSVLSNNALTINVNVSVRFKPIYDEMGFLHKRIGPDYERKIVDPIVSASVREIVGKYRPDELFTSHRETMQEEIQGIALRKIEGRHIEIEAVVVQSIVLPQVINDAIEAKLQQEQQFQEYEFRLLKEAKEAERKRIEAKGIRDYHEIVQETLTEGLLKLRGIQATLELASSHNSKVIVIGSGKNGLPIILGSDSGKETIVPKQTDNKGKSATK